MSIHNHIKEILKTIPKNPGIYQYYDENEALLYVGKAKNLKKRVSSYFTKKQTHKRIKILIEKTQDIKYIVVKSEIDALLLENSLIKKNQPKYNVMLKDDKTYPWICIKKEPFPRVFQTRSIKKDGSEYFGPYPSVRLVKTILEFCRQLYPLRSCNLNLCDQNIKAGKFKVCLEYHIKNCLGPCVGKQNNNEYLLGINHIREVLNGNGLSVIQHLKKLMRHFSENLEYEKAQVVKTKISLLSNFQSKSTIVNPKINDVDVFTIISDKDNAFVNFLKIKCGSIIQAYTLQLSKRLNETEEELLKIAIVELREKFKSSSKNIYCSIYLSPFLKNLTITVPKIGDKKKLIRLSLRNAKSMLLNKQKKTTNNLKTENENHILNQLQKDLQLNVQPKHIECFDNSNIQGENAVAACVVFKNGRASKKDYRHFNIKTVIGPNDFASMEEVIYRRYNRLLNEKGKLPELIVVDGGKGQLSSAIKALERLGLKGKVSVIGIAKRLEEIYFPNNSAPLYLNKRSKSLRLIQKLRDEAHRFGIKQHRKKKLKALLTTSLNSIVKICQ